ncbi:MAG: ribosomal-processing cysteine protease Prp [Clostridiaceae bacterium]|jgi:uncharacterized protein YsxB (DUF464 family)|nr:ribosomal-processing cysteine protease Prp [Clostridiaceae bacterium]
MTKVRFITESGKIKAVSAEGHTGFADSGEDIVCAALSSIIQTTVLGLMKVAKIDVRCEIDEKEGILSFSLPPKLTEREERDAEVLLQTLLLGVSDLYEGYSDYIELEVI